MKTKLIFVVSVWFITCAGIFAQSDYAKLQNFKDRYFQIEESIKQASSLDDCNSISNNIDVLKSDFLNDKSFLDNSLYPDDFNSSFTKLENALTLRKEDFTQISDLNTKVTTLQSQITELSQSNEDLIKQINDLNAKVSKNDASVAKLNGLISQLRRGINQRDQLVRDLVDNLLSDFLKSPAHMAQSEKQGVISKVNSNNLFYNIERTLADNIQFIKITPMTAEDFSNMKDQYRQFAFTWKQLGPRLGKVYLAKNEKVSEIADIDTLFSQWNRQIDIEGWANVNRLFREKNISLIPFTSGDQFAYSVNSYIDQEMNKISTGNKTASAELFNLFSDSVYYKSVRAHWIPALLQNNMMNAANKDTIETKLAAWKSSVFPAPTNWPIILITLALVVLVVLIILGFRMRDKSKAVQGTINTQG